MDVISRFWHARDWGYPRKPNKFSRLSTIFWGVQRVCEVATLQRQNDICDQYCGDLMDDLIPDVRLQVSKPEKLLDEYIYTYDSVEAVLAPQSRAKG